MNPDVLLGILSNLYVNGGTYGSPTWAAVGLVGDMQLPAKWDVVEVPVRLSRLKLKAKTMMDCGITGKLLSSATNTLYTTLRAAMLGDDVLDVMALNGGNDQNGCRGFRFDVQVVNTSQDLGTGVVVFDDFELIPVFTVNTPKSVLVTSGAPVLTAF